jgi:hypothetical protein
VKNMMLTLRLLAAIGRLARDEEALRVLLAAAASLTSSRPGTR